MRNFVLPTAPAVKMILRNTAVLRTKMTELIFCSQKLSVDTTCASRTILNSRQDEIRRQQQQCCCCATTIYMAVLLVFRLPRFIWKQVGQGLRDITRNITMGGILWLVRHCCCTSTYITVSLCVLSTHLLWAHRYEVGVIPFDVT